MPSQRVFRLLSSTVVALCLVFAGAGSVLADATPNGHNCEGVIGNEGNGYPGLYIEIALSQVAIGETDRQGRAPGAPSTHQRRELP